MVKAAVIEEPGRLPEVQEIPEPLLEEGSGLMKVQRSEVCGTDVHLFYGRLAETPYPLIPGHFSMGILEKKRGLLLDVHGEEIQIGDAITFLDVHGTCNHCWTCLVAKASTRCPERKVYGITLGLLDGLLGGWAEKLYLRPGLKIMKVQLRPHLFIGGGCGLPTAYHGVERSGISPGDTVVIQGSGPVGLNAVAMARLAGAQRIILVGAPDHRLQLGQEFGADATIDITDKEGEDISKEVLELIPQGADVTLEATGVPQAVLQGLQMTRDGGVYALMGQYTDGGEVTINPHRDINKKHLDIRGVWGIDFRHFYRSIRLMEENIHRFPWHKMVSHTYGLQECGQALQDVEKQKVVKAAIDPWKKISSSHGDKAPLG